MADLLCSSCKQKIKGEYLKALGKYWHPDCFCCAFCGKPILSSSFMVKDGKPYHPECYHEQFVLRCSACGKPINGDYVKAFRKYWHPEHFVCAHCGKPISGAYFAHQGKPYCECDYTALFAEKCYKCGALLTGQYMVDMWGHKYCPAHSREPRCSSCGRFIGTKEAPESIQYADGRIVCSTCLKTAIHKESDANRLVEDVLRVLASNGFYFDKKEQLPVSLSGQKELRLALHQRGRQQNTAGATQTRIQTVLGIERSREILSIQVLYGLPYDHMGSVLAHELGHAWLFLNRFPQLPRHIEEGICEWLSSLWLETRKTGQAEIRLQMLKKNPSRIYGRGYRAVKKAIEDSSPAKMMAYIKRYGKLPENELKRNKSPGL